MTKSILLGAALLAFSGGVASAQNVPGPTEFQTATVGFGLTVLTVLLANGGTSSTTNATTE